MRAYLGLGSNLGDRWSTLAGGVRALRAVGTCLAVSRVYETEPVGGPPDQGTYLNIVVGIDTDRAPDDLLAECQRVEQEFGRVRAERFGPRTLDVDVLWIDGFESTEPHLVVPHPRMFERAFVVEPLRELAPEIAGDAAPAGDVRVVGALLDAPHP